MKAFLRTRGLCVLRRLEDESGIALITAVMLTAALLTITGSVTYLSTTSFIFSTRADADQQAYSLAEAGINTAIAKIYTATDPRTTTILHAGTVADPATVVPQCGVGSPNASETPSCYSTGSVAYSGTLDAGGSGNTWYWNIKSVGTVTVNARSVTRTLTKSVGITGNNGTNGNSWSRFYQDSSTNCLTLTGVTLPANFASRGDICLTNGAKITGSNTNIQAGGKIYIDPPTTSTTAGTTATGSTNPWTNPNNAKTINASYATDALATNVTSANLDITNWNLGIPTTATINGISVTVTRHASTSTSTNHIVDTTVQLLQGGSPVGNNKAVTATNWPTTDGTVTYGTGTTDLWGGTGSTAWTYTNLNATNFGVRIAVKSTSSSGNQTASVDGATVTVYYTTGAGIGASGASIAETDTGSGCQLSGNATHSPCGTSDKVYATTNNTVSAASNTNLVMPTIDWQYWYDNARPGPKHFCTNANPGITTAFFDNDTTMNGSISVNGEMAGEPAGPSSLNEENWTHDTTTPNTDYDCEVWSIPPSSGQLLGEITWNHTTHVMNIKGTIFIDGAFRFDNDGNIIHYFGRGNLISSKEDEIDSVVCAGGSGTDPGTSCLNNMSSWDPSQNMMVLMSNTAASWNAHDSDDYDEYDQGGTTCSGNTPPTCYDGHPAGGFQGILYSTGECLIHQDFEDSGPVICNTIDIPDETYNPDFFTFPSIGNLTDGMSFSDTSTATSFTLNVSAQNG